MSTDIPHPYMDCPDEDDHSAYEHAVQSEIDTETTFDAFLQDIYHITDEDVMKRLHYAITHEYVAGAKELFYQEFKTIYEAVAEQNYTGEDK